MGADVPFFVKGGTQQAEGTGNILTNHSDFLVDEIIFLLVIPPINISTEWAYSNLNNYIWENINNLQIPCLIIRAHKSTALPLSSIKKIKKKNKSIKIETMINASLLFPFEQPEIVTKKINNFI